MHHIVQDNCFREPHYDKLIEALDRLEIDYEIVKLIPFVDDINFVTDRKDVMIWGAVKFARLGVNQNWAPGSFLNENHDFNHYFPIYGEEMFNHDSRIIAYSDNNKDLPQKFFARPTKDSKAFTGQVYSNEEFLTMLGILERNKWVKKNFDIQIASCKTIYSEARFWVVKGKVITGSYYRLGGRYFIEEIKDGHLWEYAQRMVDKHQIADAFVIDVCDTGDGEKIMEFGCINCAGFYLGDMQLIVNALEKNFNNLI